MKYSFLVAFFLLSPGLSLGSAMTFDKAIPYFENFADVMSFVRSSEDVKNKIEVLEPKIRDVPIESPENLARKLEDNPYRCKFDSASRELIRHGSKAVPYLIDELKQSSDYYRLCLIKILSEIPDSRVNAAFSEQLRGLLDVDMDFLADDMASIMIRTLSRRGHSPVVDVLKQYLLKDDTPRYLRSEVRVALSQLGHVNLQIVPDELYRVRVEDEHGISEHVEVLEALIGYEVVRQPLVLRSIEESGSFVWLEGELCNSPGSWRIKFETRQTGLVPFYYTWNGGELERAGYIGILVEKEGQWVMVFWRRLWVS